MNKAAVLKILEEIKGKVNKNLKVKMHYKDGTTETIDFLAAIGRYTNPGKPPEVKHIDFIGNYKNQGILPAMLLYLADIERAVLLRRYCFFIYKKKHKSTRKTKYKKNKRIFS